MQLNLKSLRFTPTDLTVWLALGIGLAAMYVPTLVDLATGLWRRDEQGHGPIILSVALWFMWLERGGVAALPVKSAPKMGIALLLIAGSLYVLGRSQAILMFEVVSILPMLAGLLLFHKGWQALRQCWFPIFFLLFMVPLPDILVTTITTPLKSMVSAAAAFIMSAAGYPVGRSGVILMVGQYQLLVADACAGLNSIFTLEALGLIYMRIVKYKEAWRNVFLATVLVPIAMAANIVRVVILVLVTYHFGDEAGQGFVHGFAGMVLFMVALALMFFVDKVIGQSISFMRARRNNEVIV